MTTEAIDKQIEADIAVMQNVIVYGRTIRDRHLLSMRTPLPEVTLVHKDPAKLAAARRLERYIKEELNVRSVKTALVSEVPELVRLKCLPNHTLLGKRFGKEYKGVQEQIRKLGHAELADFLKSGSVTAGGHAFTSEDILIQLEYTGDATTSVEFEDDEKSKGGLVVLDIFPTKAMLDEATAREVCAKVQKMRKEAGLRKTDSIEVGFSSDVADSALVTILSEYGSYVEGRIGRPLVHMSSMPRHAVPLLEKSESVKVQVLENGNKGDKILPKSETLTLTLCRGCAFFHPKALAQLLPDAAMQEGAQLYVQSKDYAALQEEVAKGGGALRFQLDGQAICLKLGEHFFFGAAEAAKAVALS